MVNKPKLNPETLNAILEMESKHPTLKNGFGPMTKKDVYFATEDLSGED